MFTLSQVEVGHYITVPTVTLVVDNQRVVVPLEEALHQASVAGLSLLRTEQAVDEPLCEFAAVRLPLEWELASPRPRQPDPELWFEADCGGRDLLIDESPGMAPGRMRAWCTTRNLEYLVSAHEIVQCPASTRWFVRGFLAGSAPVYRLDSSGRIDDGDFVAWRIASERYQRSGAWSSIVTVCSKCGRVLIPGATRAECEEH
jgi:hypothetical protein